MVQDDSAERFEELAQRYDALHRPGAWLDLKDELGLGSGPFYERLDTEELQALNAELANRLESLE